MIKIFKVLLCASLLMIFTFSSYSENYVSANDVNSNQQEMLSELENMGVEVDINVMSQEEKDYVIGQSKNVSEVSEFYSNLSNSGYEKQEYSDEYTSNKYTNVANGETAFMVTEVFDNGNEMIFTFTQYNDYNNEVSMFYAEKVDKFDDNKESVELINYKDANNTEMCEEGNVTTYSNSFNFNGQAFACGMTGFFACTQWYAMFGLAGGPAAPAVAGGCSVACNTAFLAACSFA